MAESAGKTIRQEINKDPIIRMPSTTVTAASTASTISYRFTSTPTARANCSSKVTAKIRW